MSPEEFIKRIAPIAQGDMKDSGILASVTIAQACLESGYGTTDLAINANNLFGMKCSLSGNTWKSVWDGESKYTKQTQEQDAKGNPYYITADFRKYPDIEHSIKDHSLYLTQAMNGNKLRYEGLIGEKDYFRAVSIIKNGGYATDVKYVEKICKIIETWNLTIYDKESNTMKICLDAGHYGKYNQSPINRMYYESKMVWKLHLLLKGYLESYGIKVITTRKNQENDMALYDRGAYSAGCDLFISLHSNAADKESVDYPVAYCAINGSADGIGLALAQCVEKTMKTTQHARIEHRTGDRGDYYGVIRGATAVGVPGLILEHSFHTNSKATAWLMDDLNLDKMARAEAQEIAKFYGIIKSDSGQSQGGPGEQKPNTKPDTNPSKEYPEGFIQAADGKRWWYQYKDGSFASNGWYWLTEKTTGTSAWYLFDKGGYMLTGYQTAPDGRKFFLCPDPGVNEGKCMVTDNQGKLIIADYDTRSRKYIIK